MLNYFCVAYPSPSPLPKPRPELVPSAPRAPRRRWPILLLIIPIAGAATFFLHSRQQPQPPASIIRTAKAFRGILHRTVRLTGSIEAKHYANILAPILQAPDQGRGLVLTYLPRAGTMVHKGDVVAEIDPQAIKDHLDDVEATVDQSQMDLKKLLAQQAAEAELIRQRVRAAKGTLDKATQDLRAVETRNRIDQELLRLAVNEARANFEEISREIGMTADRQAAQLQLQKLNMDSNERHRNRHRNDVDHCSVRSPTEGMVVMKPIYRNGEQGQVQLGDQLSPGQLFMRVVDVSDMDMETTINQAEAELVRLGQPATIHFEAYPDLSLPGKVTAVGTLAVGGRRVNYYIRRIPVRIELEGTDPRVIPDSSAIADVVVGQETGIIVPREAVVEEDGRSVIFVKHDGAFTAREVEIGRLSNTEATIVSGLEAGDEVALERPH